MYTCYYKKYIEERSMQHIEFLLSTYFNRYDVGISLAMKYCKLACWSSIRKQTSRGATSQVEIIHSIARVC